MAAFDRRGVTARPLLLPEVGASPVAPVTFLCRLPSGTRAADLRRLLPLEQSGTWINRPSALLRAHDKPASLELLRGRGVPAVPTVLVERDGEVDLSELRGDRFVVKPAIGLSGHGVTPGLDRERAAACARAFAELSGRALVQPSIGGGVDRRLFVIDGRVVAAMERVPRAEDGRGNTRYGAVPRRWSSTPRDEEIAIRASAVLGLEVAGVDLLHDGGEPLVLEVNSCPGITAIEAATGVDVADALAAFGTAASTGV